MSIHSQYVTGRKEVTIYVFYVFQEANIFAVYNLCSSIPFEELTASLASAYSVSVLVVELVVYPSIATPYLATVLNPDVVVSPASMYGLATAVT